MNYKYKLIINRCNVKIICIKLKLIMLNYDKNTNVTTSNNNYYCEVYNYD